MFQIGALNNSGVGIPPSKGEEAENVDKTLNLKRDHINSNTMQSIFIFSCSRILFKEVSWNMVTDSELF